MPCEFIGAKEYTQESIVDYFMYEISGCWKDTVLYPIYCEPNSGNLKQDSTLLYFRNFSR